MRLERKSSALRYHLSGAGDEQIAIIDGASGFVADQIRIHVGDAQRARALEHETPPHLVLAEREMARTGIEDDVHRIEREFRPGSLSHPRVLADLEADLQSAAVEVDVSDRGLLTADADVGALSPRPRLEPPRFVVNAVPSKGSLGHESGEPAVHGQGAGVVGGLRVLDGQPQTRDQAGRLGHDLEQQIHGGPPNAWRGKCILAAVAGDTQLGQAEHTDSPLSRGPQRRLDVRPVVVPVEGRLVQGGRSNSD